MSKLLDFLVYSVMIVGGTMLLILVFGGNPAFIPLFSAFFGSLGCILVVFGIRGILIAPQS